MYRVPSSQQDFIARLVIAGIACIFVLPAIFLNINAIILWDTMMMVSEVKGNGMVRYDNGNLLILAIPIIGILCSFFVIYGIFKEWPIAILIILMLSIISTTGVYIWYRESLTVY